MLCRSRSDITPSLWAPSSPVTPRCPGLRQFWQGDRAVFTDDLGQAIYHGDLCDPLGELPDRDFGMPGANRRRCGRLPALWRVQPSCMLAFSTEQEIPHEGWMGESNALTPFSITARLSSLVCFPFLPYCVLPSPVKPLYVLAAPWPWAYNLESSPTSDPVNLQKQKPKFQPFRNPEFFPWLSGLWSAGHSVYT